ncbi:MAG: GGDEF domain-containing protein [Gammaproteobacteria bacterium]|nr:GGDEF domain-containing protein [Gammaproteobacteria bacterium]
MDTNAHLRSTSQSAASISTTNEWALELSSAALDGNGANTRRALARLLARPVRRSDEQFQRQLKVLESVFLKLRSMALIDELTGLCNRRGFMREGCRLLEALRRDQHGALVFYFDVDNLKVANDSAGHAAGDVLLLRTAKVLRRVFRKRDILCRLGGDEFAVLAACSDPKAGEAITTRLHESIASCNANNGPPHLSLSAGMARFDPRRPLSLADLLEQADVAMYGDKLANALHAGRLSAAQSPPEPQQLKRLACASRAEDSR